MAWVVDTCLLLDVGLDDPLFASDSELLLSSKVPEGLVACPVTIVELGPAFAGQMDALEDFLFHLGIVCDEDWSWVDTQNAFAAWTYHIQKRRSGAVTKRPIADVLIGAFALRYEGLLTRNVDDFQKLFPSLPIIAP
jgi:predicted nucleic acid-binding protein